ncbi:hypothetical protein [Achromobacter xylosoxidans]|uniref:hypothetical protein n=1 Tax=Alcaligenes xylosoxydans xylosoxydans TaxID=85698 RepID=UPI001F12F2E2|nr:hypothetical protein [Achromobacter xylosoxidans]
MLAEENFEVEQGFPMPLLEVLTEKTKHTNSAFVREIKKRMKMNARFNLRYDTSFDTPHNDEKDLGQWISKH